MVIDRGDIMKRRAFTMMELIIGILLISIVSAGLFVLVKGPVDFNVYSQKEFDVQSGIRVTTETVDRMAKNATAAFLLTKNDTNFRNDWNYFIADEKNGKARIVLHEWINGKLNTRVLAEQPASDVKYKIGFQKSSDGKLLKFTVLAKDLKSNKEYDVTSEIKVLNSNTVVDQSTMDYSLNPPQKVGNCLAFRSDKPDPDLGGTGYHHVLVSFILDTSGSMLWKLNGVNTYDDSKRRIVLLQNELKKCLEKLKAQEHASVIDFRIYPFSTTVFEGNKQFAPGNTYGKEFNIATETQAKLDAIVGSLFRRHDRFKGINPRVFTLRDLYKMYESPGGATNVGDAIRLAYHGFKKYEEAKGSDKRVKHFLFVLTDGVPTMFSFRMPSKNAAGIKYFPDPENDEYDAVDFVKTDFPDYMRSHNGAVRFEYSDKLVDGTTIYRGGLGGGVSADKSEIIYVERLGERVRSYLTKNSRERVDVTVVGLSSEPSDNAYCTRIGRALGASPGPEAKYFTSVGTESSLEAVFDAFSESVIAATLWYVSGPE